MLTVNVQRDHKTGKIICPILEYVGDHKVQRTGTMVETGVYGTEENIVDTDVSGHGLSYFWCFYAESMLTFLHVSRWKSASNRLYAWLRDHGLKWSST